MHAGKNRGCAVALVDVAVHGHGPGDLTIALHATDGDSYVVDHAEAFAMIRESVVKPAAHVKRKVILQGVIGG